MLQDDLKNMSRGIHAMSAQVSLELMCQTPRDGWYWMESPYVQLIGGFDNILPFFTQWEKTAPLAHRCYIYAKMDADKEIDDICAGLAIEAASLGGLQALDEILTQNRPSLLPHLLAFTNRLTRALEEAGSCERMAEIGQSAKNNFVMNDENTETGRQVLARSGQLMDSVIGAGTSDSYIQGEELKIEGQEFVFIARRENRDPVRFSFQTFHVGMPYKLTLHAKDGTYLAAGCLYVPNCPVLDQITSLYISVKSGEERDILRTGNWSERSEAFTTYVSADYLPKETQIDVAEKIFCRRVDLDLSTVTLNFADKLKPLIAEKIKREMAPATPGRAMRTTRAAQAALIAG